MDATYIPEEKYNLGGTKFTAIIECGFLMFEVLAYIDEDGCNVLDVFLGDETLNHSTMLHFIKAYGEADLDEEILTQYNREIEEAKGDCYE